MRANCIGHSLCRNCFLNALSQEGQTKREDEEEDVSNYWKTLGRQEYTGIWMRKYYFAMSEELVLEEAMNL